MHAAFLRLWPGGDLRSCCSPAALERARACAHALGLPFEAIDDERPFRELVVEPFVDDYLAGLTPNPCVVCNSFRLADLVERAARQDIGRVATGHYARLVWRDGEPYLARAAHAAKDQSYMLWRVDPGTLARLEFPLGELDGSISHCTTTTELERMVSIRTLVLGYMGREGPAHQTVVRT